MHAAFSCFKLQQEYILVFTWQPLEKAVMIILQGNPPPTDLHYFLSGTGHLFNKNHALESLRRLRGLGEGMVEDLARILR
jgi:hypothetical protein